MSDPKDRDAALDAFERHVRGVNKEADRLGLTTSPVLLDSNQVKAIVADVQRQLIERCIATSFRWAVLRGGHAARQAAEDVARELRELGKETAWPIS